ncbi:MAG: hypothetical protein JWN85_2481 [Gammaproteobacteria bacterium]|nr:hypothetical protein [Gammaproteobacteria bacterium]
MFLTSERSFGRSLLFLKDQIKDLKTSDRDLSRDADSLARKISALDDALSAKRAERHRAIHSSPQAQVMGKLNVLTKEIVEVERRRTARGFGRSTQPGAPFRVTPTGGVGNPRYSGMLGGRSLVSAFFYRGEGAD